MKRKLTVLLVDDHSLVRLGFRRILEDQSDIEVIGEAGDGDEAIRLAQQLQPDVIVMDNAMHGVSGIATTRRILQLLPTTKVLMLSMHSEDTLVRQAFDAGASGYVLKSAVNLNLDTAIRKVAAGDTVIDAQIIPGGALRGERDPGLTERELEILQHVVAGESNKEIAAVLDISVNTVAVHRANMMNSLGVHNTAELVVYAIRHGLVPKELRSASAGRGRQSALAVVRWQ